MGTKEQHWLSAASRFLIDPFNIDHHLTGVAQLRDLHWAILSPELIQHPRYTPPDQWFQDFDQALSPVLATLAPKQLPELIGPCRNLGQYFERLWFVALDLHPYYHLSSYNQQIQWQGQTLGALDFLVTDQRSGELEHWELTVKFFLRDESEQYKSSLDQWLGINARDSLAKKYHKMYDHQLPLSDHPASRQMLEKHKFPAVSRRRSIFKGRLFSLNRGPHPESCLLHPHINPMHLRGYWGRLSQYQQLCRPSDSWRPLTRFEWLADRHQDELTEQQIDLVKPGRLLRYTQGNRAEHWAFVGEHWPDVTR